MLNFSRMFRRYVNRLIDKAFIERGPSIQQAALDQTRQELRDLVRSVDPKLSYPNVEPLWELLRDIGIIKMNLKSFGYEVARSLSQNGLAASPEQPPKIDLGWRGATQADIDSDWAAYWSKEILIRPIYHRKVWELVYVLQTIWYAGKMQSGMRGLGFGCGEEVLPSYLAKKGVDVVATDLPPTHSNASNWRDTNQHAASLARIWRSDIVDRDIFDRHVSLKYADMNDIPDELTGFDFCWSICAFEHLGSIENGLNFIENSLEVLKPGGISVHTTEFNFLDGETIDNWPTVLFQRRHFQELYDRLIAKGHSVGAINFDVGTGVLDRFVDMPPYINLPSNMSDIQHSPAQIKVSIDGFPCTCFGLVVTKKH